MAAGGASGWLAAATGTERQRHRKHIHARKTELVAKYKSEKIALRPGKAEFDRAG
jgi:hypothetical protein